MKKLIYTLLFVLISVAANGQAKYVFYFIGDGMGVNQGELWLERGGSRYRLEFDCDRCEMSLVDCTKTKL